MLTPVDKDQVARAACLFLIPGSVSEVRLLDVSTPDYRQPHVVSGYFTDAELLLKELERVAPYAKGSYITLNPVAPALLARAANRLKSIRTREPLTSDRDVLERRWILLDFDPVRPAGISSTNEEHQAALNLALEVRSQLGQMGFMSPVLADSGNGAHLLYLTQLPAEEEGLVKDLLLSLASKFDSNQVKVDTSVFNPARISKLYGTLACKGDNTPDRPHRLSRLLEIPENLEPTSPENIRAVIEALRAQSDQQPVQTPVPAHAASASAGEELRAWAESRGLVVQSPKIMGNGGILYPLEVCPFNSDHRGGSAYIGENPSGARFFGCHHNSCQGRDWHSLRDLLEPDRNSRKNQAGKVGGDDTEKPGKDSDENRKSTAQSSRIVELVLQDAILFHSTDGSPYAALQVDGHQEIYPLRSRSMRAWCSRKFWELYRSVPGSQAIQDGLLICGAMAESEGGEAPVYVRIGNMGARIFLDLGDELWQAAEIDDQGWRIVERPAVMFRRPGTLAKLPLPRRGGTISDLRQFLNLASEDDFTLVVAFLLGAFQSSGPFPLLDFIGEQGTSKSTSTRLIKRLIDPATSLVRNAPRCEYDLMLAAQNNHLLSFDNISRLPGWMSDALCRLSTGGGVGTRRLYSDDDEIVLDFIRPVVLNGITDFITRPDLLDRAILLELAPIPEEKRRLEREYWAEFSELHPFLLGAILDQVSGILCNLNRTRIDASPRMADFITFSSSAESTLGWKAGSILNAYNRNRTRGEAVVLESSRVAQALLLFLVSVQQTERFSWHGTASELLSLLRSFANPNDAEFPTTAHELSGELRRLSPTLRKLRVSLSFDERAGHSRDRLLNIEFDQFGADAELHKNSNS